MDLRTLAICLATAVVAIGVSFLVSRGATDRVSTLEARVDSVVLASRKEAKSQADRARNTRWWCNGGLCERTQAKCREIDRGACYEQRVAYCMAVLDKDEVRFLCMPTLDTCKVIAPRELESACIGVE